jgi:hypothetical protein
MAAAELAVQASAGLGRDDPPLDEAARLHWRRQALEWTEPDLADCKKRLAKAPPRFRQQIRQTLVRWQTGPSLASVREPAALAGLPEAEQEGWRRIWAEVKGLLQELDRDMP